MQSLKGRTAQGPPAAARAGLAGLLSIVVALPALAAEPEGDPPGPAADASGIPGIGQPIAAVRLDRLRGGDGTTSWIDVDGEVSGNSADHITSGMNLVDGGSFGNAAGVSTVIQNSGSNVLIQNAMILNVRFSDPVP